MRATKAPRQSKNPCKNQRGIQAAVRPLKVAALHMSNDGFQPGNSCSASPAEDFAGRASVSVISAFFQTEALATHPSRPAARMECGDLPVCLGSSVAQNTLGGATRRAVRFSYKHM
jgi:hypothetical protein